MAPAHRDDTTGGGGSATVLEERPSIRAAEPRDRQRGLFAAWVLLLVLGLWLAFSPFALDYGHGHGGWWVPLVVGALLVIVSAAALAEIVPNALATLAAGALGVLLFAGGLALADTNVASWNAVAGGALAVFLAAVAAL
jgi:hypothetical protein